MRGLIRHTLLPLLVGTCPAIANSAAQPPAVAPTPALAAAADAEQAHLNRMAATLRTLLAKNLPNPLLETPHGWGDQREVVVGMKMERHGPLRWNAVTTKDKRNDGHWQKVRVESIDPDKSLAVKLTNPRHPEIGKTLFDAVVNLDVRLTYEQQVWKSGVRLYAGETRARCQTELKMVVELTDKLNFKPESVLPELLIRVRVVSADLAYHDLVCEHTLGVGGDAAKLMGKAVHEIIKKLKPDMETDLLKQANAAIVKAADTKEIRVDLGKLIKK